MSYIVSAGVRFYAKKVWNMILKGKAAPEEACECLRHAQILRMWGDGLIQYVCAKCGLKFYSHRLYSKNVQPEDEKGHEDKEEG